MLTKKQLEIALSRFHPISSPNPSLEQYQTPSSIAADVLWNMHMLGDKGSIADLGCGNGILGLGALLLDNSRCYFVDIDSRSIELAQENKIILEEEFHCILPSIFMKSDILQFSEKVDVVIENPPFGVQAAHADKKFLEHAFSIGRIVYSFHKIESKQFIEAIGKDHHYMVTHLWQYKFSLPQTMKYHTRKNYEVNVGVWRLKSDEK